MNWQFVSNDGILMVYRTKLPGGWLIAIANPDDDNVGNPYSVTFYPDPNHIWDGQSLP